MKYGQTILGFALGILAPILSIWLMITIRPEILNIQKFDAEIVKTLNVQIITMGMLLNVGLFFAFLRFDREKVSQGILVISFILIAAIFIYKFLL